MTSSFNDRKGTVSMKVSLKTKTFIMIFIMTAVLCAASIIGTNIALTNIIRQQFIDKAESLTNAMADLIDKEAAAKVRDEVMKRIKSATRNGTARNMKLM